MNNRSRSLAACGGGIGLALILGCGGGPSPGGSGESKDPKQRTFRFEYGAVIQELKPGAKVRVWIPVPPTNDEQQVSELSRKLPAEAKMATEPKYGNRMLYFEVTAAESEELPFQVAWRVKRSEAQGLIEPDAGPPPLSAEQRKVFLAANRMVPVGDAQPLALLAEAKLPDGGLELGKRLYETVDGHMKYDKSKPGFGQGDALRACTSPYGNCTDFHSLFISLARSKGLPARFEIGFPLPSRRGQGNIAGYHCWASFFVEAHGWVPVDISEADKHPEMKEYYFGNLTEDRVSFTMGRDLDLAPRQTGEPLNFFIYPYVEVDGKQHEALKKQFRFEDL